MKVRVVHGIKEVFQERLRGYLANGYELIQFQIFIKNVDISDIDEGTVDINKYELRQPIFYGIVSK